MNSLSSYILTGLFSVVLSLPVLAAREVTALPFSEIAFSRTLAYPATVINLQQADVASETSGRIIQFDALTGDRVNQGQIVVTLDCQTSVNNKTRIEASIKQLKARKKLTEQQLKRATRLSQTSSISREELDQRKTQLEADKAGIEEQQALLATASQNVSHCQIRAPFDGLIIRKITSVGSYATPGSPQFTLLKPDALEVRLEIPPAKTDSLKQARSIVYETEGKSYPLAIRKILPLIDQLSHQQLVQLQFKSTELPPSGSYGLVKFDTAKHFIASHYIQKRDGKFGVFIVEDNKARFKLLENAQEGQSVTSNLSAETLIINDHLQLLSDNEAITVTAER